MKLLDFTETIQLNIQSSVKYCIDSKKLEILY